MEFTWKKEIEWVSQLFHTLHLKIAFALTWMDEHFEEIRKEALNFINSKQVSDFAAIISVFKWQILSGHKITDNKLN